MERTIVRKQGKGHGPCKPVNEMALDSRTGEEEEILDQRVTDGVASGQDHPPLHPMGRSFHVRNRMLESGASGSVRGEGSKRPHLLGPTGRVTLAECLGTCR